MYIAATADRSWPTLVPGGTFVRCINPRLWDPENPLITLLAKKQFWGAPEGDDTLHAVIAMKVVIVIKGDFYKLYPRLLGYTIIKNILLSSSEAISTMTICHS